MKKTEVLIMQLYMPTKVYSEKNCVQNHAREIQGTGKKAMLISGKTSARKTGALADVIQALGETPYVLFDDIEENPSIETVMAARDLALQEGADFFIGIGGGSAMDAAKAIALMAANPDRGEEVLYTPEKLSHLPVVCVPTTCGTGSEVTPYAILTIHARQAKKSISHRIFPTLALMDAGYLRFLPRHILVNTCVDALCHLIESYLNTNSNDLNRVYSREGLRLWGQFKDRLLDDAVVESDYATMLHASMLAGMAITHTGTSLPHGLSYAVTYHLGIPHGKACGLFIGGYVDACKDSVDAAAVAALLGFDSTAQFRRYMAALLGEVAVDPALLHTAAEAILADPSKLKNCPYPVTKDLVLSMFL